MQRTFSALAVPGAMVQITVATLLGWAGGSLVTGTVPSDTTSVAAIQQAIGAQQWSVFTRTGVNHLMSISGLHITMLAALAFTAPAEASRSP